ncbi:phage holin family protein [Parabacteroides pacaensis]|uniref:phage holin family protein n=1 Tax=Parabacteroides pacaensis TaxID=2086575 RepID=UPI000D10947C|nr:phage holin family protein [Parabacteroides pacaensis]
MRMFEGIYEMLILTIFEFFVVLIAMGWDFCSGYYKAKLRHEERNSYGLRRTVSKFILYAGSMCIASGIDSICYVCRFWEFIHLSPLSRVPVVTSIISVFILVTEVRSIWEKADAKQRRQANKTAQLVSKVLTKDILTDVLANAIKKVQEEKK